MVRSGTLRGRSGALRDAPGTILASSGTLRGHSGALQDTRNAIKHVDLTIFEALFDVHFNMFSLPSRPKRNQNH